MFSFDRTVVDVPTRSVELDGESHHLEPQAFDLLAYLIAHRDRVVPKSELLDEVWGDQFVSESALTTRIKEIRRAVGDDGARQSVIKNFRGRGYRFVAPIEEDAAAGPSRAAGAARLDTSLLGREADIAGATDLLDGAHLVTFVGPGGVGKTELARDVALRRRDLHSDGVSFVHLASVRDADAVRHQLRRDIGLDEAGPADADLIAAIAGLDALIVIDNCEHVIGDVARLVASIVEQRGTVRLLTTSRERLGLSVEQVWRVEPLDEATARRLLLERARAGDPAYVFPAESDEIVDDVLRKLDRLPLAIEMAAARLPSLGLDDLDSLLDDRLDLLRTSDRSVDDRHRTISDLIAWSEDLLDEHGRDLLTSLSTFAGPAVVDDVAAVADVESAQLVTGALGTCVDHSLVVVDTLHQPTTYRLLETVRANAALRRTPGHEARHAARVIDVAVEMDRMLRTPDEAVAATRLQGLEADLRLAHRWARQHDPARAGELTAALIHYAHERQWSEPTTWAEELLDTVEPNHSAHAAAAAACAGDHANLGQYERASALAESALECDDPRVVASALDTLINVGIYTGDLDLTRRCVPVLRSLGESENDATISANVLTTELMILTYDGHAQAALDHLEQHGLPAAVSPTGAAWVAYIEGDALSALGREQEAIDRFDHAIDLAGRVGSRFVVSVARLSALAARSGFSDLDGARAAFLSVLTYYRRIRSTTHAITALRNLVELLVRSGDDETAMVLLGALSNPDVKATYGSESDRVDAARATVDARVEQRLVEEWTARGAAHDPLWAVDHAINVLS